jgi:hypothetical protein
LRQEEENKRLADEKKAKEEIKFKKLDNFFTQGLA